MSKKSQVTVAKRRINPYLLADEHASYYREKSQVNPHPSISQVVDTFDESIPHLYPLFTIRHWGNNLPEVCREKQFITNCGRYDGECKTEKGSKEESIFPVRFVPLTRNVR